MVEAPETISKAEVTVISILLTIVVLFGCSLNAIIVATYVKWYDKLLQQASDVFALSFTFANLLVSLLVGPLGFASYVSEKWTTGNTGCVYYGFISTWFGLSSILQLTAMALERYITLSKLSPRPVSKTQALQVTAGCWLVALLASCFPVMGWSKYTFEGYRLHCSILWDSRTANNASYNIFLLIVFFVIPIITILISCAKIYFIVRDVHLNASERWGADALATKESYKARVKSIKRLALVIAGFMFAWTPYAVVSMVKIIGGVDLPVKYQEYPSLCAKLAVVYNPLIYFFSYRRLRVKAIQMIKKNQDAAHAPEQHPNRIPRVQAHTQALCVYYTAAGGARMERVACSEE